MNKTTVIGIIFALVVIAVILYSSFSMAQVTVKVCMSFEGRTNCASASGATRDLAMRAAVTTACAPISGGVTGTIACEGSKPVSVEQR